MIIINVYGLDQYTVGHYSKEHTKNIAQLFETSEDQILFVSTNNYVFYQGVEQTSWNAIIKIDAPEKYELLEEKAAKYLIETFKEFSINLIVRFEYFHSHHEHSFINKQYPRFITETNIVSVEEDESDEIYEGNVFKGMEEKLEEVYKSKSECCCDDDCDCEEDHCDCEEGECHCGHHH